MERVINVKVAAKMAGITAHTVRGWERRYGAVSPSRTPTGRRTYTSEDIQRLRLLGQLVKRGHQISFIATLPNADLEKLWRQEDESAFQPTHKKKELSSEVDTMITEMMVALSRFDLDRLSDLILRTRVTIPTRTMVLEVFGSMMAQVGRRVMAEEMTVAQEHAFSAIVRDHLGQVLQSLKSKSKEGKCLLFATTEGDLHEFGILLSAILAAGYGHEVRYLGPNMPANDLGHAASMLNADVVILGTVPLSKDLLKISVAQYVSALHEQLPRDTEIWVGGDLCNQALTATVDRTVKAVPRLNKVDELFKDLRDNTEAA